MAEITEAQLARVSERITAYYPAEGLVSNVFESESQRRFVAALVKLVQTGAEVKVGGRRLRELIGCKVMDFAPYVVGDINHSLTPHELIRIGRLAKVLQRYPLDRMVKPDLDLFFWNASAEQVVQIFKEYGFQATITEATGKVEVVNITGEKGAVTLVNGAESWQVGDYWPMYAATAEFSVEDEPHFDLNIGWGRMYLYPLVAPLIDNDPLNPKRLAYMGRALLWLVTNTDPAGKRLRVPDNHYTQTKFYETVSNFINILELSEQNPSLEPDYRSGIRDMALALRVIILNDWNEIGHQFGFDESHCEFFNNITAYWTGACLEKDAPKGETYILWRRFDTEE